MSKPKYTPPPSPTPIKGREMVSRALIERKVAYRELAADCDRTPEEVLGAIERHIYEAYGDASSEYPRRGGKLGQ